MQAVDKARPIQTRRRQWFDRSDFRFLMWPQSSHRPIHWLQCEHSAAHLRSEPGREAAHAIGHRSEPAAARCRPGASIQRCRFRYATLNSNVILLRPYKANICNKRCASAKRLRSPTAWRGIVVGLSERGERLPHRGTQLRELGWLVLDLREPTESRGRKEVIP